MRSRSAVGIPLVDHLPDARDAGDAEHTRAEVGMRTRNGDRRRPSLAIAAVAAAALAKLIA
jgi:hypothetical protein